MKRNLLSLSTAIISILLSACAAPTQVTGDAWDYQLKVDELGLRGNWALGEAELFTAHDLHAEGVVTSTASLANAQQVYIVHYQSPASSEFGDYTLEIVRYPSTADAELALSAEALPEEWHLVDTPALGDASRVWQFNSPDTTLNQGLYRVDFRHLNVIVSVTMIGSAKILPDHTEPLNQARKVLAKLQAAPEPPQLSRLRSAQTPDLRTLLLTQSQLGGVIPPTGSAWSVNSRLLPGWTNNEDFASQEARQLLDQLGRITGYQMWLVKPPAEDSKDSDPSAGLFQQVSAYQRADSTANGLKAMIGLPGAAELSEPPRVGEAARAWNTLIPRKLSDGREAVIAATEISFRTGPYVASLQLQSQPITNTSSTAVLKENYDRAVKLAQALANNLDKAKP